MYKKVMKEMLIKVLNRNGYGVISSSLELETNECGYISFKCKTYDYQYHQSCGIITWVGNVYFRVDSDYTIDSILLD